MDVPDGLSLQNILISLGTLIGTAVAAAFFYKKPRPGDKSGIGDPHEFVLTSGSIADMRPVREGVERLKGIEAAHTASAASMQIIANVMGEQLLVMKKMHDFFVEQAEMRENQAEIQRQAQVIAKELAEKMVEEAQKKAERANRGSRSTDR